MSINSTVSKVQYTLTAANQTLAVPFYFLEDTHLKVIKVAATQTTLTQITHYTVTGAANQAGGQVILTGTATAIGDVITILRNAPATQLVDYAPNGKFPAETHERALDKLTMLTQQLIATDVVGLRFQDGEVLDGTLAKSARSGKVFTFDANGVPVFVTAAGLVQGGVDAAGASATAAAASASAASGSASSASGSASAASGSASAAATSASNAASTLANAVVKAGSVMTGLLTLSGNGTTALHAVPKQQAESIVTDRAGNDGGFTFRNLIINGRGSVNQRGYVSNTGTSVANQYTLDRWRVVTSGQALVFTPDGSGSIMYAPAGGVEQVIEASSNDGSAHTISWVGDAVVQINGGAVNSSPYTFSVTANNSITVKFTISPGGGSGIFKEVQVEQGTQPTVFELRPAGVELALCQRYYQTGGLIFSGNTTSGSNYTAQVGLKVEMRAAPTVTLTSASNTGFAATAGTGSSTSGYVRELRASNATVTGGNFSSTFVASAEL